MLNVVGRAGGADLTAIIYERGEDAPSFRGAPDEDAPYVLLCDEFYEVEGGGSTAIIDGTTICIAFETPIPRGFETKDQALAGAKDHIRTQFARIGLRESEVDIEFKKRRG